MAQKEYKHFRRKLEFIKYLIEEKKAPIDLNKTMRVGGAWWVDNEGKSFKAINSREFLKALDEAYNLNIDYNKSVARGYKTFVIFEKESVGSVETKEDVVEVTNTEEQAIEEAITEVEPETVVEETKDEVPVATEVKATKRGTRKSTK